MSIIRVEDTTNFIGKEYKLKREAYDWVVLQRKLHWSSVYYLLDGETPLTEYGKRALTTKHGEHLIVWPAGAGRTLANIVQRVEYHPMQDMEMCTVWVKSVVPYVRFKYGAQTVVTDIQNVCVSERWAREHGAT